MKKLLLLLLLLLLLSLLLFLYLSSVKILKYAYKSKPIKGQAWFLQYKPALFENDQNKVTVTDIKLLLQIQAHMHHVNMKVLLKKQVLGPKTTVFTLIPEATTRGVP